MPGTKAAVIDVVCKGVEHGHHPVTRSVHRHSDGQYGTRPSGL
jgi:hypothetical protein